MKQDDLRRWAAIGAEKRLVELAEEAAAIYANFPELRDRGQGARRGRPVGRAADASVSSGSRTPQRRRRRRRLSAEARKRISDAQKARWAKQRKAAGAR
jgi:hypothetical protein